jgi:hypothetical protein
MFDPSFFSFGNGLFYNPMTDSVVAANTATVNTATVKGREYDVDVANNLKNEIANQTNVLGVNHQASFSKDQDKIITDMANQLASYGVTSLADLKPLVEEKQYWAEPIYDSDEIQGAVFTGRYSLYDQDPTASYEGPSPTPIREATDDDLAQLESKGSIATRIGVINQKTGEEVPVNKLNNAAGSGFTHYNVEFIDGQAVPYSYKSSTGVGQLGDQIKAFVSIPPVAAALTAMLGPVVGFPAAAATVQSIATGDLKEGLKAGATAYLGGELSTAAKDLGLDNIFTTPETSTPTSGLLGTDAEAQIGGFYGNTPTAEFDPRLGGTYLTRDGKDIFIPYNPTDVVTPPISTVTTTGVQTPSLLDTIPTVTVTGRKDEPVDLLGTVQVLGTPEIPTVEVIGKRPDEPEMPTVEIIGTRPEIPTVEVIGTKPEIPTVEVIGTKPEEPEMPTVTIIGTKPEEPEMPTVTVTAPKPPVEVIPVEPPSIIEETPLEPETPFELPSLPTSQVPMSAAEQQAMQNYLGVDYSQLLALLSRNAGLLSPAQTYYRGLLG